MNRSKILLAQEFSVIADSAEALSCYDVIAMSTLAQAQRAILDDDIDVFVIGIHFDDSNALDLVRQIRSCQKHYCKPVILIRVLPSQFAKTLKHSVMAVQKLYDIADYLELEQSDDPALELCEAIDYQLEKSQTAA